MPRVSLHSSDRKHGARGTQIILFARMRADERAFWCLGPATYVRHAGERPMELYGNGAEVRGWSVMIKQAPTSDGGANWYWLEVFDTSVFADGPNAGICTGCHTSNFRGLTNGDLVLTPFPLQ